MVVLIICLTIVLSTSIPPPYPTCHFCVGRGICCGQVLGRNLFMRDDAGAIPGAEGCPWLSQDSHIDTAPWCTTACPGSAWNSVLRSHSNGPWSSWLPNRICWPGLTSTYPELSHHVSSQQLPMFCKTGQGTRWVVFSTSNSGQSPSTCKTASAVKKTWHSCEADMEFLSFRTYFILLHMPGYSLTTPFTSHIPSACQIKVHFPHEVPSTASGRAAIALRKAFCSSGVRSVCPASKGFWLIPFSASDLKFHASRNQAQWAIICDDRLSQKIG